MRDNNKKTEYLLQSIGEIDDRLLDEAMSFKPAKRKKPYFIAVIAACLATVFLMSVIVPLSIGVGGIIGLAGLIGEMGNISSDNAEQAPEDVYIPDTLDALMERARDERYIVSYEELDKIDQPCIVWQYNDSEEIYAKPIDDTDYSGVKKQLGRGYLVGEESPSLSCRVWIVDENGIFRTPYLRVGAGNEDVRVFEYEAEIVPADELVDYISGILE